MMLFLLFICIFIAASTNICRDDKSYCSIGVSRPWVGDIAASESLHSFLASVPFKREIIGAGATFGGKLDPYGDVLLQLHWNLLSMGFAHHTFIAFDEGTCRNLQDESEAVSCVWDSSEEKNLPEFVARGPERVWIQRLRFIARTIRLGFNVMLVDADTVFFQNPYIHLKQPPLSKIQFLCNPEAGNTIVSFYCNGGYHYVRGENLDPDGPVAWLWMDAIRTVLLRADDKYNMSSKWTGNHRNCQDDDQAIIADSLLTAAAGRPLYLRYVWFCKLLPGGILGSQLMAKNGQRLSIQQAHANMEVLADAGSRGKRISVLPNRTWMDQIGWIDIPEIDTRSLVANITIPNLNYGFPDELGGIIYPELPSGKYSSKWIETLKNDCPKCPWFNERRPIHGQDPLDDLFPNGDHSKLQKLTNDPARNLFIDPAIKQETFGYLPRWLSTSLIHQRRGMSSGPNAKNQESGYLSVGHIHAWGEDIPNKMTIRKLFGGYNYSLGALLAARRSEVPYETVKPFNRVIALDPKIDLSRVREWGELASILTGLIQIARLSKRVFLMPSIPCSAQYIYDQEWLKQHKPSNVCLPPFLQDDHSIPLITYPVDKESGELVGGWSRRLSGLDENVNYLTPEAKYRWQSFSYFVAVPKLLSPQCTKQGRGIIDPDFHHWLKSSDAGKKATIKPTSLNTVFRVHPDEPGLLLDPPLGSNRAPKGPGGTIDPSPLQGWSWYDRQAAVPASEAIRELESVRDQPLIFLSHPVRIVPTSTGHKGAEEIKIESEEGKVIKVDPNTLLSKAKLSIYGMRRCRAINLSVHGLPSTLIPGEGLKLRRGE